MDSLTTRFTIHSITLDPMMFFDDQKRIEKFIFLDSPKFSDAIREVVNEFLIDC